MGRRVGDATSGGVGFSDNLPAGVTVEKKTGTVSVTAATVDGFINNLNRNDGEQPAFSNQSVKAAVDSLKAQQAQQGGAKTAVYQTIKGENGKEKFVGLDKDGNLTMQDVGKSSRPGGKGLIPTQIVLSEKAKALILESESAKFAQERAEKPEAALKDVTVGGKQFLLAVDKEGNSYKSEVQMSAPKKGKSFSAGAFLKSPPKLDEKFQSVVIEASLNKLQEQRAAGATGDLVKALEYNGMNKLVALRADGKAETIDFSAYKAKNGAEALAVDKAVQELREWQKANPGQEASKKIKVSKKISFKVTLNADGSIKDIKRIKKKKQGFFAKIGSFFKKALQVLSIATMFIPGLQPIALGLRIANAVVGVADAVRNRNWLGVLGSAAGAFGGSLANTITRGINTVSTVVNVARNGLGNAWDAISTVAGTVSSWAGGAIGRVSGYISQGASAISSFARGDGWNGAIALGNLAGSVYQDSRAANQRPQASSSNRDTQNDQLMISLDQPLPGTAPVDRVRQAYEGIYGRMNDRQNAALQLAVQNANRRGITDPVGVQNYVNQTLNLLSDNRNLSNNLSNSGNRNTTSWVNQLSSALNNRNNPVLISGNTTDLRGLNIITGSRTTRNENTLESIRKKLGNNISFDTLLDYADTSKYRSTDSKVQLANRFARAEGYGSIYELVRMYRFEKVDSIIKQFNSLPSPLPVGDGSIITSSSGRRNAIELRNNNGIVLNDAEGVFPINRGVVYVPQDENSGYKFAQLAARRDPTVKYLLPPPEGASPEFLAGYQRGSTDLLGGQLQEILPSAHILFKGGRGANTASPIIRGIPEASSHNFSNLVRQARESVFQNPYSKSSLGKNLAISEESVNGQSSRTSIAVSGQNSLEKSEKLPERTYFIPAKATASANSPAHDRSFDTERVILENFADRNSNGRMEPISVTDPRTLTSKIVETYPDIRGKMVITTERPPCLSCFTVGEQFKTKFPNMELEFRHLGVR
jgi:hypothetical protein